MAFGGRYEILAIKGKNKVSDNFIIKSNQIKFIRIDRFHEQ